MLKYIIGIILLAFLYVVVLSLAKASSRGTPGEYMDDTHSTTSSIDE